MFNRKNRTQAMRKNYVFAKVNPENHNLSIAELKHIWENEDEIDTKFKNDLNFKRRRLHLENPKSFKHGYV